MEDKDKKLKTAEFTWESVHRIFTTCPYCNKELEFLDDLELLSEWEDFQCEHCKKFFQMYFPEEPEEYLNLEA